MPTFDEQVRHRPRNLVEVEQDARFIVSSIIFIVKGPLRRCCQENSAKCQDL